MHILIVDDEQRICRLLKRSLGANRHVADVAHDGETGLMAAQNSSYDLIILDLGLPDIDGLEVCRRLRSSGCSSPVLMLTARDEVEDRVNGLDAGADDYLGKPFALSELLARIRALARRPPSQQEAKRELSVGDLTLNTGTHRVYRGTRSISLSAKEFTLLEYLMRNPGQVMTRQQILEHVWNYDYDGLDTVVDTYIHYLRDKIDTGAEQRLVHTIRGVGYTLRAEE